MAARHAVKVRIGVGTGTSTTTGDELGDVAERAEALGFDSLWWSDVLSVRGDDPLAAMAFSAGRTRRLKIGTTMVLPGRNPVRLAKQLATLDRLSGGRLLLVFVLGLRLAGELDALRVRGDERGALADEALGLLRRLWTEDDVHHRGATCTVAGISVEPKPLQAPLDVWLGGSAPGALRRVGALADGWLPALCTPEEAAAGRAVVDAVAAEAGRHIDPEHFGVSIGYSRGQLAPEALERVARRRPGGRLPSGDEVAALVPGSPDDLRRLLDRFIAVGFSKFVLRPLAPPRSWSEELDTLADAVLGLQT